MMDEREEISQALQLLAKRCPRLAAQCYWAGTSAIAVEELQHRRSFDLDFHTRDALADVRPILTEIQAAFPGRVQLIQAPDRFGSGFRVLLALPSNTKITVEVLSNFADVEEREIVASRIAPIHSASDAAAVSGGQVVERAEARDLFDIGSVLQRHPELERLARAILHGQDAILITERLLGWTDADIERDLAAYPDAPPLVACEARDLLLRWLREQARRDTGQ